MVKKVLGKGLEALLSKEEQILDLDPNNSVKNNKVIELPIEFIKASVFQPRKIFDENKLQDLANSIKKNGLIQPIVVTYKENNNYEIVVGERRWRAYQKLALKKIPVIIKESSNYKTLELALIENIQRQDLNAIEEAISYKELLLHLKLTQEELSSRIGKSRVSITNKIRLLKLPELIQQEISSQKITEGHGRALLSLKNLDFSIQIKDYFIESSLSVRQSEKLVQIVNAKGILVLKNLNKDLFDFKKPIKKNTKKLNSWEKDTTILNIENQLKNKLQVKIYFKNSSNLNKGKIEINYNNSIELEQILKHLGIS